MDEKGANAESGEKMGHREPLPTPTAKLAQVVPLVIPPYRGGILQRLIDRVQGEMTFFLQIFNNAMTT
jgi:hypothetical protein